MEYIDLIGKLSELDKKRIENYIFNYGVRSDFYIGTDKWLQNWSHSNQLLYKLLGNSFIYSVPIEVPKEKEIMSAEIYENLFSLPFKHIYHTFYTDYVIPAYHQEIFNDSQKVFFNHLLDCSNLINNEIEHGIKFKKEGVERILQIQPGTKPMKAVQKIIDYFKNDFDFGNHFEEFRLVHSRILNDKMVKGELCFSIHPLDYITMSDNDLKWSSCMSWRENGCYHVGTIEMMNSNNVVCCYLKSLSKNFIIDKKKEETPDNTWTNKKWRCLGYVTKDIIMSGKAYPYKSETLSLKLIEILKNLAKENLDWNYQFGPEPYEDMKHIYSKYAMDRARGYMAHKATNFKKNILWDTKGMYNDMLNDSNGGYQCYRNKVDHTKIISVSGKATCLCCGNSVIENKGYDDDYYDAYNERFYNVGNVICNNCLGDNSISCDECEGSIRPNEKYYIVKIANKKDKIFCNNCINNIHLCRCCGKPLIYTRFQDSRRNYYFNFTKGYFLFKGKNFDWDKIPTSEKELNINSKKTMYDAGTFMYDSYCSDLSYTLKEVASYKNDSYPTLLRTDFCEDCTKKLPVFTEKRYKEVYTYRYYDKFATKNYFIDMDNAQNFEELKQYLTIEKEEEFLKNLYNNNTLKEGIIIPNVAKIAFLNDDDIVISRCEDL
jgi:hypothetical protein